VALANMGRKGDYLRGAGKRTSAKTNACAFLPRLPPPCRRLASWRMASGGVGGRKTHHGRCAGDSYHSEMTLLTDALLQHLL